MATTQVSNVLQHVRRLALLEDRPGASTGHLSDGQLLGQFIERRDADAFAAIVRRHGPMVWGVCQRLLGSHHDVEDAFQATFLVLVRKAASIVPRDMAGNWLYGVAYQTALKSRAKSFRRKTREKQVFAMPEAAVAAPEQWHDLRQVLDHELSRLPDKYRVPVVLCDLEGRTRREAARHLRVPEGTLAGRLAKARQILARRLSKRGVCLSASALAALLAQSAASAGVPAAVLSATIKAGTLLAAGKMLGGTTISAKAASLTEGVVKAMLLAKLKVVAALAMILAIGGIGFGGFFHVPEPAASTALEIETTRGASGRDVVKSELAKLQGTWMLVGGAFKGKENAEKTVKELLEGHSWQKLVILDKNFTWGSIIDEGAMKGSFTIDPGKKRRTIDFTFERDGRLVTGRCIYEWQGEKLRLCYGEPERPKQFKTSPDSDMPRLYVWKRLEKQDGVKEDQPSSRLQQQAPARKEIGRILLSAELRIMDGEQVREKQPNRILLIDPESGEWKPVGDADAAHNPRLSPDGKTIAFGTVPDRGIWTCDANGGNLKQIFDKGSKAIWSADGKRLVVTNETLDGENWKFETWQIDPDGSNATKLPLRATDCAIDSSPDGKWITTISGRLQSFRVNGFQTYIMRPDGTNERLLTHGGANIDPRFSPDSKKVLYTGYERGNYKAWTVEIQGGKRTEIYHQEKRELGVPVSACWSPDGKRIAMVVHDWERTEDGKLVLRDRERGNYRLMIMDTQGQNSKQLKLKNARLVGCDNLEWR